MKIEIIISGIVQGVWFRKHTQDKALELNLTGYVKNLDTGQVYIYCEGSELNVGKMIRWAHVGSPNSSVEDVEFNEVDDERDFSSFEIIR
jgi:acylphosphatase